MSQKLTSLLLATHNPGKIRELEKLLDGLPIELKSLTGAADIEDVAETGSTFRENAELKAAGFARQTGLYSLADDSGLEVEALGNAPGIHSARFAGAETGYDIKIPKLLAMLDETGDPDRRARFVCAMALSDHQGKIIHVVEGTCVGSIAASPRGTGGFGYDPIFRPDGFDLTFGELGEEIKQKISHRAEASRLIIRYLLHFTAI